MRAVILCLDDASPHRIADSRLAPFAAQSVGARLKDTAPGPILWHYRQKINALVYRALDD
jgi:hypothetical protein